MNFEKNRHLLILRELLMNREPVTADHLSKAANTSVRTVKSDIPVLSDKLNRDGIGRIVSLKARGYIVDIDNEEKFNQLYEEVAIQISLFQSRSIERTNRLLFILQSLLTFDDVKINELSESLYISSSSLAKELHDAREFLESYGLKLISVPGKGAACRRK